MPPVPDESGDGSGERDRSEDEPKVEDTFHYMDIAPAYRDQVTRYGNDRLALPSAVRRWC